MCKLIYVQIKTFFAVLDLNKIINSTPYLIFRLVKARENKFKFEFESYLGKLDSSSGRQISIELKLEFV